MACISPWPRIGLSTYIVCRHGTSKPVSHTDLLHCPPLCFEVLLFGEFLALRRLLEIGITLRFLALLQFQLSKPAFVINRHGRLVFNRAQDVIDADVIAEYRPRVRVGL